MSVWVNGCFDLFHAGHLCLLKEAYKLSSLVTVGVNTDESIRQLKGDSRPIIPFKERVEILRSLDYVHRVVAISGTTCENEIIAAKPDYIVKGNNYSLERMDQDERKAAESIGAKIKFIQVTGTSTTEIIERIKNA